MVPLQQAPRNETTEVAVLPSVAAAIDAALLE
jgi:hypothetical protein